MPRFILTAPFCVLLATLALAACTGNSSNTSVASAKPTATPKPFHDVTVHGRAITRIVSDENACFAPAERAKVAVVANDTPVPLALRAFGATGTRCWREVRSGDSAFNSSQTFEVFIPHVAAGGGASAKFAGAIRPATSVEACISAGKRAHVPTAAMVTVNDAGMFVFKNVTCARPISSDDSAADSATQFAINLPARDIAK